MATSRLIPQGIPTITEFYFDGSGTLLDKNGTSKFKAQANYTNMIIVYMEDGNTNQEINLINFSPKNTNRVYTSHWFYLAYAGVKEHIIQGEVNPRVFTAYYIIVPNLVLQNNKVDGVIENDVTIVKRYGVDNKGTFNTFDDLINTITPNQELMENNAFAYVLTGDGYGFYQVGLDINSNTYVWELRDNVMNYGLEQKPMEVQTIYIQKGYANVQNLPDINTTTIQMLMQILNSLSIKIDSVLGAILNVIGLETKTTKSKTTKIGQDLSLEVDVKISQDNKNIKVKEDGLLVDVYTDEEIDEKFEKVSDRIDLIDGEGGRLDKLDEDIVRIDGDILGINTDLNENIKPRLTDVENLTSNNEGRIDELEIDLSKLVIRVGENEVDISKLKEEDVRLLGMIVDLQNNKADKTTLEQYATITLVKELIKQHNDDPQSHEYILTLIANLMKGGTKPLVFISEEQLFNWLEDRTYTHEGYLPDDLAVGQLLLTEPQDELDYWVKKIPCYGLDELVSMHDKVDLSNYYTKVESDARFVGRTNLVMKYEMNLTGNTPPRNAILDIVSKREYHGQTIVYYKDNPVFKSNLSYNSGSNIIMFTTVMQVDGNFKNEKIYLLLNYEEVINGNSQPNWQEFTGEYDYGDVIYIDTSQNPNAIQELIYNKRSVYMEPLRVFDNSNYKEYLLFNFSIKSGFFYNIISGEMITNYFNVLNREEPIWSKPAYIDDIINPTAKQFTKPNLQDILNNTNLFMELYNDGTFKGQKLVYNNGSNLFLYIDTASPIAFYEDIVAHETYFLTNATNLSASENPKWDKVVYSEELGNYVLKEAGKGLSTNDFTNALKTKLDGLDTQTELDNKFDDKANNTDLAQLYGGKNLASPDLTGKEYLGQGEYLIVSYDTAEPFTLTYNVYSGIYTFNGLPSNRGSFKLGDLPFNLGETITMSFYYVSGSSGNMGRPFFAIGDNNANSVRPDIPIFTHVIESGDNYFKTYFGDNISFNNHKVKIQIEKGSTATAYTLPMVITPEYIRQTQTPRLIYSNSGTSSGTDITFSYVDNTMKVGDVYKVHSQLTYDNSELTQREVNDLIISDTVNNNIEKNHYAQTQHSAITKVNYDYTTKTITMIGDFNAGDSSNSFNIRLYKVGY